MTLFIVHSPKLPDKGFDHYDLAISEVRTRLTAGQDVELTMTKNTTISFTPADLENLDRRGDQR
jgi:hypothetical protein